MKKGIERNSRIFVKQINGFVRQLAVEKKKAIVAVCLLAIMTFMWIRLFFGNTVQKAGAEEKKAEQTQQISEVKNSDVKINFVELPHIKGRNDVLKRDFFTIGEKGLSDSKREEIKPVIKADNRDWMEKIADKISLEVVVMGERPRAYINDKLLGVGDMLTVRDEQQEYECEIIRIDEMEVTIKCGEGQVTLTLAQPDSVIEEK
jgi:hypothetical protein